MKLTDAVEADLEAELDRLLAESAAAASTTASPSGSSPASDRARAEVDVERWCQSLVDSLEGRRLDGLSVVIDCANGSSSTIAPGLLRRLGATVEVLHAEPDGRNINERCGSTHPADLQRAVVAAGAAIGLAFDGDADRVLAVDERGELVDGDHLIALCALDLRERGRLTDDAVVVTVMTNLGFRLAMAEHGIEVVETQVGDRYVLEALDKRGLALGGEQSGHVIFRRLATTGDGLLTGLQLLDLVARADRTAVGAGRRGHDPPAPGAGGRPGRPPRSDGCSTRWPPTSPRSRPSSVGAVACWCGRAAPSRWCESWWRLRTRPWPGHRPTASPRPWPGGQLSSTDRSLPARREAGGSGVAVDGDDLAARAPGVGVGHRGGQAEGRGRVEVAGGVHTTAPGA